MKFVKNHLLGLIVGIVGYEIYYRQMGKPGGGGKAP
jgi:hypothetical protein